MGQSVSRTFKVNVYNCKEEEKIICRVVRGKRVFLETVGTLLEFVKLILEKRYLKQQLQITNTVTNTVNSFQPSGVLISMKKFFTF